MMSANPHPSKANPGSKGSPNPGRNNANEKSSQPPYTEEELEELRKIRRLQMVVNLVMSTISQSPHLTVEQASEMCADTKRYALSMFPDKELAYDLLYRPRLQRLMNERYHLQ
jgi:hypothetical protein